MRAFSTIGSTIVAASILLAALPLAAQERRVVLYRQADGSISRHPHAVVPDRSGAGAGAGGAAGLVPRVSIGNLDCSFGTGANACLTFRCFGCFQDIADIEEIADSVEVSEDDLLTFYGTTDCTVTDVNVAVELEHPRVSDLEIALATGSEGAFLDGDPPIEKVRLFGDSECEGQGMDAMFDDGGSGAAASACAGNGPAIAGHLIPVENLAAFDGLEAGAALASIGTGPRQWALSVVDTVNPEEGLFAGWALALGLSCSGLVESTATIDVDPPVPTTEEQVTFTMSGTWPNTCVPEITSTDVFNGNLFVTATSQAGCAACGQAVTNYDFEVSAGPFAAGEHTAFYQVRRTCEGSFELEAETDFTVVEPGAVGDCAPGPLRLCIDDQPGDRRFEATVSFRTTQGQMPAGPAKSIALGTLGVPLGGLFYFTNPQNPEILLKVLNFCTFNGHYGVFYSAGTNFEFDVLVRDTVTGEVWLDSNPDRTLAPPVADLEAFGCVE